MEDEQRDMLDDMLEYDDDMDNVKPTHRWWIREIDDEPDDYREQMIYY